MDRVLTYLDGDIVVPLQICLAVQIVLITIVWRMMSRKQSSSDKDKIESKKGKDEQSPVKYDFLRERELKADEHPRWFLPKADRDKSRTHDIPMYIAPSILQMLLKYDIDPTVGFLPKGDPLQRLPRDQYGIWEDLGDDLGDLLCARLGQARDPLSNLPVISIEGLTTNAMMRRAHLLLCLFAHAYVWGGPKPKDVIPAGISIPLCELSDKLNVPPVLTHAGIVLYNWRRLDANGAICMENLTTLNEFFGSRDESWFYLITVEIEARGADAIVPMMVSIDAIQKGIKKIKDDATAHSAAHKSEVVVELDRAECLRRLVSLSTEESTKANLNLSPRPGAVLSGTPSGMSICLFLTAQLRIIGPAIAGMVESLVNMREGCHPFIFYHRVRPFLSAWKQNPTLPDGVIYEGYSTERKQYYGGSAAQSPLIPLLDIGLGIDHTSTKSCEFLLSMRAYMLKDHRDFLEYLETIACIREFVLMGKSIHLDQADASQRPLDSLAAWEDLSVAYNACVKQVEQFRQGHMDIVHEYIVNMQSQKMVDLSGEEKRGQQMHKSAGGKGTGGTDLMRFLRPLKDNCTRTRIALPSDSPRSKSSASCPLGFGEIEGEDDPEYQKENGSSQDIDIFQAARGSESQEKFQSELGR